MPKMQATVSLEVQLRELLSTRSLTCEQISRELGVDRSELRAIIDKCKRLRWVFNVGGPAHPIWTWGLAPNATKRDLMLLVVRLISERPMTLDQVAEISGASVVTVRRILDRINEATLHRRLTVQHFGATSLWFLAP